MRVSLIGHLGYVGQNIKNALLKSNIKDLYLIDRKSSVEEAISYIGNSDVVIHCAAIQRPAINTIESFLPNFNLTKRIVDNLPKSTKLIFLSSIHYKSETPFGVVRRMEEEYIQQNVINYTIYHLPYTYGIHGKPDYNNVFNTYIINVGSNKEIVINDFVRAFPLISMNNFSTDLILNLDNCLNVINSFATENVTLPDFVTYLSRIHRGKHVGTNRLSDLKSVYDWYKCH